MSAPDRVRCTNSAMSVQCCRSGRDTKLRSEHLRSRRWPGGNEDRQPGEKDNEPDQQPRTCASQQQYHPADRQQHDCQPFRSRRYRALLVPLAKRRSQARMIAQPYMHAFRSTARSPRGQQDEWSCRQSRNDQAEETYRSEHVCQDRVWPSHAWAVHRRCFLDTISSYVQDTAGTGE